jgi:lipopolysaccharide biosynthesis glycosyltransferase
MNTNTPPEIVAATAADENYVVPLVATVRSAIDCLGPNQHLRLFILDGGVSDSSRAALMSSWADRRVRIEWIRPDINAVKHLPVSHHVSISCYLRLLLPSLLPEDVGKLIYFDSVFECLETNSKHVLWWDQYALNVELAGKWRPLDVRWNQTAGAFEYPSWRASPLDAVAFEQVRNEPWIVHFCSPTKPWHYVCDHPYRKDFYATLQRTAWRDWSPEKPSDAIYQRWRQLRLKFRKACRTADAAIRNKARAASL